MIPTPRARPTPSHKALSHDSLDALGYDWSRVADPSLEPTPPFKVYLPRSTEDVVRAVAEARALGETLRVRGRGHSSNNLVLEEGASVLVTGGMDRLLAVDEGAGTATAQAGMATAELDRALAERRLGLPVIGDHSDITLGGFASVGGIGLNGHLHGLFVDNVEALQYVGWEGGVVTCSRTERSADFHRLLAGTGRHGVITALTVRVIAVDKSRTVVESRTRRFRRLEGFVGATEEVVLAPPLDARMIRGLWLVPGHGGKGFGLLTRWYNTRQSAVKRARDALAHGLRGQIGRLSGRVPRPAEHLLRYLGGAAMALPPRYASITNVEVYLDRVVDFTAGEPGRWLIVWGPAEGFTALFHDLYRLVLEVRARHDCFWVVSVDVRPFRSAYLSGGDAERLFVEILFYLGIRRDRMTADIMDDLVTRMDDACVDHASYRYMHTLTSGDPERRRRVDPNTRYAEAEQRVSSTAASDAARPPSPGA